MSNKFNSLFLVFIVIVGIVNGAWWEDEIQKGKNPWKGQNDGTGPTMRQTNRNNNDEKCKCVLDYQCDNKTGIIITDGLGIIGWRSARQCSSNEVCCLLPEDAGPTEAPGEEPLPADDPSAIGPSDGNIMGEVDEDEFAEVPDHDDGHVNSNVEENSEPTSTGITGSSGSSSFFVCGVVTKANVELKVSGDSDDTETQPGNFPWTLILKYILPGANPSDAGAQVLLCGASLILPSVAITAAHCLDKKEPENIIVRAGEWDLASDDDDLIYPQERRVKKIKIHPKYDVFTIKNDVAILFLDSPFESSPTVNTICMPSSEEKVEWTTCYATGWGAKGEDALPTGDQTLKKALLPLIPRQQCEQKLRKTKLGGRFKLHKSFICAGGESDADTCKGDGGGPLACQNGAAPPYNFHLIGITSWGVGCAKKDVPGVYTDVTEMSDWIATEVENVIKDYDIPAQ